MRDAWADALCAVAAENPDLARPRRRPRDLDAGRPVRRRIPRALPPDGHRRAEHGRRRGRPRDARLRPVAVVVRRVPDPPGGRPGPDARRPDPRQRQDRGRLHRAAHGQDRQDPPGRRGPGDHARDAGHDRARPGRRHRVHRDGPLGERDVGTGLPPPGARCGPRPRRPGLRVRPGTRPARARGHGRPDRVDRDADGPLPRGGRAARGRRHLGGRPPRALAQAGRCRARSPRPPRRVPLVVSAEEHSVFGGLGGLVAEILGATDRRAGSSGSGSRTRGANRPRTRSCWTATACRPSGSPSASPERSAAQACRPMPRWAPPHDHHEPRRRDDRRSRSRTRPASGSPSSAWAGSARPT